MTKRIYNILILLVLTSFNQIVYASIIEVRGIGTTGYQGSFFSSDTPTDEEKQKAIENAKISAWKNYVAKQDIAQQKIILNNNNVFLKNLKEFITDLVILDQENDANLKTLTIVIRASFNTEAVSNYLESISTNKQNNVVNSDSLFTFLLLARKESSITQFNARQTSVAKSLDHQSVSNEITNTSRGVNIETDSVAQTGGNSYRQSDKITYIVSSNADFDSALGSVLTTSGIQYVSYNDVVSNCNAPPISQFQNQFVTNDKMSFGTRKMIISAVRSCEVKYFALGTIDSNVGQRDPVSGNIQNYVSVNVQLWDLSKVLPIMIGSVGPIQYSGLGPDENTATRNALAEASNKLGAILVDQLSAKKVR